MEKRACCMLLHESSPPSSTLTEHPPCAIVMILTVESLHKRDWCWRNPRDFRSYLAAEERSGSKPGPFLLGQHHNGWLASLDSVGNQLLQLEKKGELTPNQGVEEWAWMQGDFSQLCLGMRSRKWFFLKVLDVVFFKAEHDVFWWEWMKSGAWLVGRWLGPVCAWSAVFQVATDASYGTKSSLGLSCSVQAHGAGEMSCGHAVHGA